MSHFSSVHSVLWPSACAAGTLFSLWPHLVIEGGGANDNPKEVARLSVKVHVICSVKGVPPSAETVQDLGKQYTSCGKHIS